MRWARGYIWSGCNLRWDLTVSKVHFHMQWVHMPPRRRCFGGLCSIACHNDAFIFHSLQPLEAIVSVFSLSLSLSIFLSPISVGMFSLWGRASWPRFFQARAPSPKSNPNELLEYSKYSTQIQYRAYFMCLYSKASIIIWHKCRCVYKEG